MGDTRVALGGIRAQGLGGRWVAVGETRGARVTQGAASRLGGRGPSLCRGGRSRASLACERACGARGRRSRNPRIAERGEAGAPPLSSPPSSHLSRPSSSRTPLLRLPGHAVLSRQAGAGGAGTPGLVPCSLRCICLL